MNAASHTLAGRRIRLRPLGVEDFEAWREVRRRGGEWLTKWEPKPLPGLPDVVEDRLAFISRCGARERDMQMGSSYGFGIFLGDQFIGEMNINSIHRGPFQNAYIGYWIDPAHAGNGYTPEALVVVIRFAFEVLGLHRVQVSVIPRNTASRRVAEKLGLRDEGIALRYLEIDGVWEDHVRYAFTSEDWESEGPTLIKEWL